MKKNTEAISNFVLILVLFFSIFNTSCKKKPENGVPIVKSIEVNNLEFYSNDGSNNITIRGNAVGEVIDEGGSQARDRGFVWGTTSDIDIDNNEGMIASYYEVGLGSYHRGIHPDIPDTTYFLRAIAINEQGVGYGDIISFETPSFIAPEIITLEANNVNANGAILKGELLNYGDYGNYVNPKILGFCYGIEPNITLENGQVTNNSFPFELGTFESEISNLENSKVYYYRAYAMVGSLIYYGEELTFTTKGPPIVEINEITDITSNQAVGGGQVISDGGYEVTAVGLCWSRYELPTINNYEGIATNSVVNGSFTSLLRDLIGDKIYKVRAFAINEFGVAYSEVINFRTLNACEGVTEVTDIDGNTYRVIPISGANSSQCWMAENLNVSRAPDGSSIQRNCYDNNSAFCELYGGLYTWHTAMNGELSGTDRQGICPDGWRLPNRIDFQVLNSNVGGEYISGRHLKSCRQVDSPFGGDCNTNEHPRWDAYPLHYGTDDFGFSAVPGGFLGVNSIELGESSYYWMSEEYNNGTSYAFKISWDRSDAIRNLMAKYWLISIRCIKEGATYGK